MRQWTEFLRRLIAVIGATASGKSALALSLAQRFGGEIVNADSRQIYRGMDIGTAKPSPETRVLIPHHLYDIADPSDSYSLALYRKDARTALENIWARGEFAWLVGGTGQYVWALLEAWQVPDVPPQPHLRAELEAVAQKEGVESLHGRLRAVDPEAAGRIDARNVRRVIRALEVQQMTGRPISIWQTKGSPDFEACILGVHCEEKELVWRINRRVEAMFASGLVDETQAILDAAVPADASALSSIGYAEAVREIKQDITREKAIELTKRSTKRLARRQRQWFRLQDSRISWTTDFSEAEEVVTQFLETSA
ncbi:MAG: tRNA (adenosine(37)-N6)-dimethylallyltransferase MiaA [Dehalococcoidia bacterium]|nr:tRNA (adenosine(37)-N6)-dimethylallyltransferase MiaA [Dehalococcoidia bacterium]